MHHKLFSDYHWLADLMKCTPRDSTVRLLNPARACQPSLETTEPKRYTFQYVKILRPEKDECLGSTGGHQLTSSSWVACCAFLLRSSQPPISSSLPTRRDIVGRSNLFITDRLHRVLQICTDTAK